VVAARATVVEELAGHYGMAMLGLGVDEAERLIAETAGWLEVSAVNSASSTVVSGDRDAVTAIVGSVEERGVFARAIAVDYPGHTSALERLQDQFRQLLPASDFQDGLIEFVSSARGSVIGAGTDFGDYWCQNLRNTVRFDQAVATAIQRGAGAFVELSAHPSLLTSLLDLVDDAPVVGCGRRGEPAAAQLSASISTVALADPGYRWADVADLGDQPLVSNFPNAPMRSTHLWVKPAPLPPPPGSLLTVAAEEWQLQTEPTDIEATGNRRGIAIVGPGVTDCAAAGWLAETIAAHDGCFLADADKAEITVVVAPALMDTDVTAVADQIAGRAGGTARTRGSAELPDYTALIGPRCRGVWLVTAAGVRAAPDDPVALPAQAALAAMHRCVGFEFPDQTFGQVDLPAWNIGSAVAGACLDVLLGDSREVALRGGGVGGSAPQRYTRVLRNCGQHAAGRALADGALDSVVITGGSGAIGLSYARHCVERGARRIILLSRKGVDADELDRLGEGYSAEIHAPACDITDWDALATAAAEYAEDGASLLIHAAGTARFAPRAQLTDGDLADVFSAKVQGLAQITTIWPLRADARILVCSSVSGVWGGHGHAGYAAANRLADILAAQLRANGLDCMAVRWGLWQNTSIAGADEIGRIERSGLIAMDPDVAVDVSLRQRSGDPLIFAADFDRLRKFFISQGIPMPFTAAEVADQRPDGDGGGVREAESVSEAVRAELASALSLADPSAVDMNAALIDLGVDSLLALDLRKRLRSRTGSNVSLARLLGGITGAELIDALQTGQSEEPSTPANPPERAESSRD
ncbi:MAG TPA: SDR family NAD(P)-dependent oxidoreductase, partial [Mycobacterium sp.]|nr:SDR family NAD(P)-dependent oxidoreductase [Mycobacterium sp.]